ncbi:MAG TPA: DUF1302 family protein [Usitatibacteraceae bacterium]
MKQPTVFLFAAMVGAASASAVYADEPGADGRSSSGGLTAFLLDQRVSGVMRADYFRSSKNLNNDTDFLGATAQIKALPTFSEALDGKLELRITNPALGKGAETRGQVLEGYATAHFEKADLRIGRQIVAWGRADGINPTDNLTPRDYVVLLPFEDDQRFGTTAVKLDAFLSQEHTVTIFVTPFFEPSKIPLPTTGSTLIETKPQRTFSNAEVGLKLNRVSDGFDWSISAFHGFNLLPEMRLTGNTPTGPIVELHYDRVTVLGADFARNYGRFGLRGEMAYVDTTDKAGTDPGVKNPYLSWVVGVDRTFFENLNVNLQFFQRRIRRYQNPEAIGDSLERSIAIQNAVLSGQRDRLNNGISFRVSNKWFNNTLEAEIFAVFNLTRNDRFVRPLLSYAFNDQWKGTVGAEFYGGANNTQFGGLKSNRGVFAELRYGF